MRLYLVAALSLATTAPLTAANLVENGNFDTDAEGWLLPTVPSTELVWDSFGNPAGSLRISSSQNELHFVEALGPCIILPDPDATYEIIGTAYAVETYAQCRIEFAMYETSDCTGSRASAPGHDSPGGVWEPQRYFTGQWGLGSLQATLINARNAIPPTTCYFDNIVMRRLGGPLEVPTLGRLALFFLVAVLAGVGIVTLRRARRA